jgi:hypothetical protein
MKANEKLSSSEAFSCSMQEFRKNKDIRVRKISAGVLIMYAIKGLGVPTKLRK